MGISCLAILLQSPAVKSPPAALGQPAAAAWATCAMPYSWMAAVNSPLPAYGGLPRRVRRHRNIHQPFSTQATMHRQRYKRTSTAMPGVIACSASQNTSPHHPMGRSGRRSDSQLQKPACCETGTSGVREPSWRPSSERRGAIPGTVCGPSRLLPWSSCRRRRGSQPDSKAQEPVDAHIGSTLRRNSQLPVPAVSRARGGGILVSDFCFAPAPCLPGLVGYPRFSYGDMASWNAKGPLYYHVCYVLC